ncbi:acyl-CoA synthetase [Saccharopolyspora halophila]|uniref:Acyl-CoA synthetase n=1 Tax=Saccharopolyspora halophila TaxID=405551 RepID=A0ABN3GSJ4_9PSEU
MDVSFGTIWEAVAERLPHAVAVSEPGVERDYAEFERRSAKLACALERAGIRAGDRVGCYLYNGSAYLETVFAAFKIGAVPVNVNYRYTRAELTGLLADAEASALVFSSALGDQVTHAAAHLPALRLLVRVGPGAGGPDAPELEELLARTPARPAGPRPGTDRLFMYTGGTTGKPKGVIWRLSDLLNSLLVPVFRPLGVPEPPKTLEEAVGIAARVQDRAPRIMPVVPLMHGTGLFNSMGALLVGGRVVTARVGGLDAGHVWRRVAEQRVSTVVVAGTATTRPLVDELRAAECAGTPHDLRTLRSMISSGTAFDDELKRALHERAEVNIFDAIASSEGGPFAFAVTAAAEDLPSRFFPVPGTEVRTADGTAVAEVGETGVLAYSGPMPLGYHDDPAKTAETFREVRGRRYAIPGDLARLEPDGSISFLGRSSTVINTGGEKVHPPEVEEALLGHPDVTDCAVVGLPDERWGEVVAALVATTAEITETDLQDWARRALAGYKIPRRISLRGQLPRSPTGKIELARVRELLDRPPRE